MMSSTHLIALWRTSFLFCLCSLFCVIVSPVISISIVCIKYYANYASHESTLLYRLVAYVIGFWVRQLEQLHFI
jgi:hypothetical protein